jgi:hypothetical protein
MRTTKYSIIGIPAAFIIAAMGVHGDANAQAPRIDWATPDEGMLVNNLPEFVAGNQHHVVFTDRWQHEEYALFQGGGAQSEMILSLANERDNIVLNYVLTVRRNIETWNINRAHSIQYGPTGRIDSAMGTFFYQQYTLGSANRNCVGYYATWDERLRDDQGRPSKAVFGYYCAAPGNVVTTTKVGDIIDGIEYRGVGDNVRFEPTPPKIAMAASGGQSPSSFAKGTGSGAGNSNFPFDIAVEFQESESENIRR